MQKNAEPLPAETPLAERSNMAFSSTLVTYGQGRGVVCATGAKTEVGRISELVSAADVMETPLTRKIARFSRLLLVVILALAAITFVVGVLRGETPFGLGVFSNPWIAVGVTAMVALQLAFTYLPFMNHMFHSAPIGWYAWWLILLTGSAVYVIVGTEKLLRRQWAKRRGAMRTGTA